MNKENKAAEKAIEKVIENTIIEAVEKTNDNQITILLGDAPKQLELHALKPIKLEGAICSPRRFCDVRSFERTKSHAMVSLSRGEIILIVNEQATNEKFEITGRIKVAKEFKELGINSGMTYSPEELAKSLKLKRSIFKSKTEHAQTIAILRTLKAKVTQDIEKAKDDRANINDSFAQSVESNCPDTIKIKIPLIEGGEPADIELNIVLEADNGRIICSLESVDAAELIDEFREKAVIDEVTKIENRTTVIYN